VLSLIFFKCACALLEIGRYWGVQVLVGMDEMVFYLEMVKDEWKIEECGLFLNGKVIVAKFNGVNALTLNDTNHKCHSIHKSNIKRVEITVSFMVFCRLYVFWCNFKCILYYMGKSMDTKFHHLSSFASTGTTFFDKRTTLVSVGTRNFGKGTTSCYTGTEYIMWWNKTTNTYKLTFRSWWDSTGIGLTYLK